MAKYEVFFSHRDYPHDHMIQVEAASRQEAAQRGWDQIEVSYEGAEVFAGGFYLDTIYEVQEFKEPFNG